MTRCRLTLALLACMLVGMVAPARAETIAGGHYGDVHLSMPHGTLHGFVVLFSPISGWSDIEQQAADRLAAHQLLVVGVDSGRYAATLAALPEACHLLVGDAESLSHQLQREFGAGVYFTPILAGIGEGGRLAEQVLSMAASNTIAGAVSLGPTAGIDARFKPCPPDPTILHDPGLPGFWSIGTTAEIVPPIRVLATQLRDLGARIETREFAAGTSPGDMLLALSQPHLGRRAPDEEDVSDLPLIELPAARQGNRLAIIISGDGGWRDLDQTLGHELQRAGVSVLGIDSLRYFWSHKTPAQTAHDLARAIRTYSARWHAGSVALVGYSFGADVLPFAYNRLPAVTRSKVTLMALLGFAPAADFEIHVTGWLGMPPTAAALPAMPEIAKVPPGLVQCFYGEGETDTLCPRLAPLGVTVIRTGGNHHFGRDYAKLAQLILEGWQRRLTGG